MLKILFKIVGLSAASGLVFFENQVYIIADNSTYLYLYTIENKKVTKFSLSKNPEENTLKKEKKDFEAIFLKDKKLYILGSGSKEKREKQKIFNIISKSYETTDLTQLYLEFKKIGNLTGDELNIEGCLYYQEKYFYFQRGNAGANKNGIFIVEKNQKTVYIPIKLPKIKNVELTFTDATLVDKTIYFLAAAEGSNSTYNDGEILGTWIGKINFETFKPILIQEVSKTKKFEGITLYKDNKNNLEFLLCEDGDTETFETIIYKLSIAKK